MPTAITMPKIGQTMTEGTLIRWIVTEGAKIEKDQIIAEIETDKTVTEYPADASGTVGRLTLAEGSVAEVGDVIGWILGEGESVADIP